ncbi:hypothetical protein Bca101_054343 [Brassica carinata]
MSVFQRQSDHLRYHQHPGFFSNSLTVNGGDSDGFLTTTGLDLPEIYGETTTESNARLSTVAANYKVCTEKKMMMNKGVVVLQEVEEKSKITEENNEMKNKAKKRTENGLYSCSCTERPSHSTAERFLDATRSLAEQGCLIRSLTMFYLFRHKSSLKRFLSMKLAAPNSRLDFHIDEMVNSLVCTLLYDISLKRFLSMKLAAPNSRLDFHIDEMVNSAYPHEMVSTGHLHFNPMQQVITSSEPQLPFFNVGYAYIFSSIMSNLVNFGLLSGPCDPANGQAPSMWEPDVQNIYSTL